MLALKIGNKYLDLDEATNIAIQTTSPLLDTDSVGRAFTFDFELPNTPGNISVLRHPNRLEKFIQVAEKSAIELEKLPYLKGVLNVVSVQKKIRVQFAYSARNIFDELGYELSTFAQETVNLYTTGPVVGMSPSWSLTMQTNLFVDGVPNVVSIKINDHRFSVTAYNWNAATQNTNLNAEFQSLVDAINTHFGQTIAVYQSSWPRIWIAHNEVLDFVVENKISVTPQYSVAEYEQKRIEIAVNALMTASDTFVFPQIYLPNYYTDNLSFKFFPVCNQGSMTTILNNQWSTDNKSFWNSLAPGVKLSYILGKIATRLGLELGGDWWAEDEAKRIFFWNGLTLDEVIEEDTLTYPPTKRYLNRFKKSFTVGDFLPKMTAKELLQALSLQFGVYCKVQSGKLLLNKKKSLYGQKSRNWTPYLIPETLRFGLFSGKGVKLAYNFDKEAVIPVDQLQPLSIGDGATAYTMDILTLPIENFVYRVPKYWGKENTIITAWLFDRSNVDTNRYATCDNKDMTGAVIDGAWSLELGGANGVYQQHLKAIVELINAPECSASFDLSSEQLAALERGDFVRVHAHTPEGTLRAVIKSMKLKPNVRSIGFAEVEMLRI